MKSKIKNFRTAAVKVSFFLPFLLPYFALLFPVKKLPSAFISPLFVAGVYSVFAVAHRLFFFHYDNDTKELQGWLKELYIHRGVNNASLPRRTKKENNYRD